MTQFGGGGMVERESASYLEERGLREGGSSFGNSAEVGNLMAQAEVP